MFFNTLLFCVSPFYSLLLPFTFSLFPSTFYFLLFVFYFLHFYTILYYNFLMAHTQRDALEKFENTVGINFRLYNSLFLSLPFHGIEKTGTWLSLFNQNCEEGYQKGISPVEIVEGFFDTNTPLVSEKERLDLLFRFVQYAERQVVLFDALEDASFNKLHNINGNGTITQLENDVLQKSKSKELAEKINDFSVRLVLTAHPTQFYPGSVLGIINDLKAAIETNDTHEIKLLLQQLGRTRFFKKQKPTPFDEATSLIWFLENVFYQAIGEILSKLETAFPNDQISTAGLIKMGFWSGGDRDGNPFVDVGTTLKVADSLRAAILRSYYDDIRELKRRLTFSGVEPMLAELEQRLYQSAFRQADSPELTAADILAFLGRILETLDRKYDGLFAHMVENLIFKVRSFGVHFASLDIRQDSSVHRSIFAWLAQSGGSIPEDFAALTEDEKIGVLLDINNTIDPELFEDELFRDTILTIRAIKQIQKQNGEAGCHRYIISHSQTALDVVEVIGLFLLGGWTLDDLTVDIVPLFETVDDLTNAAGVMRKLYNNEIYRRHIRRRGNCQTIMLGFSDGTKDGGYMMANWGIYKAKEELTAVSREFDIEVIFFDGRGGPPARGGGKTHKFFASMGRNISDKAIELTVQGQTVSTNFGTVDAARFNIEQLLSAGVYSSIFTRQEETFDPAGEELMADLAAFSFTAYSQLKNDPAFLEYLANVSPLKYFGRTNIGSRPAKRGGAANKLTLDSLRAIPFVSAWSQIKQNVPGFYGVGSAISRLDEDGKLEKVAQLYDRNPFFKALIDNCEMAMQKTFLPLTSHLENDELYGRIWRKIRDEFELTLKYLAKITSRPSFMTEFPVSRQSVIMREQIVLPLTTIQQYALTMIRKSEPKLRPTYESLVIRCSFGIINAGRNSA